MNLIPLGNRVIIKVQDNEEKVVGGIILPETAKTKQSEGEVIAVGNGKYRGETLIPVPVKPGDNVIYRSYNSSEVDLDKDGNYIIIDADDILAIKK